MCARGVGPSARARADGARGIQAGDGRGAIRNQRWTARSRGAHNFRGKFLDPREIAETADAAGFTPLPLGWGARERAGPPPRVLRGSRALLWRLTPSHLFRGS